MVGAAMTPSRPRVTIITALYNHEDFIGQAVASVLSQTFADFEYLIWDDGSQDRSIEVAKAAIPAGETRVQILTHPGGKNRGQEATRNEALKAAQGDYICLLDSDDYWLPRKLELQVQCLDANPKVGLVYAPIQILLNGSGKFLSRPLNESNQSNSFDSLVRSNFIIACSVMFRRACLENDSGFDARYGAIGEYPLWLRIAHRWELNAVREPVAVWRIHGSNTSTKRRLQARRELVHMVEDFLADPNYSNAHGDALRLALNQYRYDLAVMLLEEQQSNSRDEAIEILANLSRTPLSQLPHGLVRKIKFMAALAKLSTPLGFAGIFALRVLKHWRARWRDPQRFELERAISAE